MSLRHLARKHTKVWEQISAFLFAQSNIGPFGYENWMVLFGVPAFVILILVMEGRW